MSNVFFFLYYTIFQHLDLPCIKIFMFYASLTAPGCRSVEDKACGLRLKRLSITMQSLTVFSHLSPWHMCNVKTYSRRVWWKHLAKVFTETSYTVTVLSAVRHHGKITMFHIAAFIDTFLHVLNLAKLFKVIWLERCLGLLLFWRSRRCTFVFGNRVAVSHENYCRRNNMRSNVSVAEQ